MDEVNIKYLSQFNPILIVPVLSAVFGAIFVFLFGFKRPNEPRFQSSSSIDSLKKSKRKASDRKVSDNAIQSSKQQIVSSAKVSASKKATDAQAAIASKKGPNEKSSSNNNNTSSSNNNNISKKKTDEKKSENGSPTKKVANKKTGKESTVPVSKKPKANKNLSSETNGYNEKPADFDDGGWFTVQSKSAKQKNKIDDSAGSQIENASPKSQGTKTNKSSKSAKAEAKPILNELNNKSENLVAQQPAAEPKNNNANAVDTPTLPPQEQTGAANVDNEPGVDVEVQENIEIQPVASVPIKAAAPNTTDNAIAFDEMGDWTDAKPDRKRGNKKKSRKD